MKNISPDQWEDAPPGITDHWRLEQLKRDWWYYGNNALIRQQIEAEIRQLFEVLGERGGLFGFYQVPYDPWGKTP